MTLLVDTSVWSLALRRDAPAENPQVARLVLGLRSGESILGTGLVLQELLQGFRGARDQDRIVERFRALPLVTPERDDHVKAALLRNSCRRRGIQIGTIDGLLAQICLRHELTLLTTDKDFTRIAESVPLQVWSDPDAR